MKNKRLWGELIALFFGGVGAIITAFSVGVPQGVIHMTLDGVPVTVIDQPQFELGMGMMVFGYVISGVIIMMKMQDKRDTENTQA